MNVAVALQGLASLLWVLVIGLIVLAVVRSSRGQKVRATSTSIIALAVAAIVLTSVSAGLVFIEPEERGVVISALQPKGYREEVMQPGLRWVIPFVERVVRYPISRQTYTMSRVADEGDKTGDDAITARTADGQEVKIDASVIYSVDPALVITLHIQWQGRYNEGVVRPLSRGIIRDAISQYGVAEVYSTKRAEVVQQMRDVLTTKLEENGLLLIDFVLRDIAFSPEYAASVEQKQIAEQLAQQAKFTVEQRKNEAEQARQVAQGQADAVVINAKGLADARVIQAQAESQALQLIANALKDSPDLLSYTYINKLAPGIQVMLVPNNAPYLLPLPTMGPSTAEAAVVTPAPVPTPLPTPAPTATP
jgi:regulator of protease activity HflC (stomatin/prohibitin superfamily)